MKRQQIFPWTIVALLVSGCSGPEATEDESETAGTEGSTDEPPSDLGVITRRGDGNGQA